MLYGVNSVSCENTFQISPAPSLLKRGTYYLPLFKRGIKGDFHPPLRALSLPKSSCVFHINSSLLLSPQSLLHSFPRCCLRLRLPLPLYHQQQLLIILSITN